MAIYRTIQMSFWTDTKVADDFTPEDRYFYLYLFTNPHTNLAGCYEISIRQMANETGYSKDTVERLIKRFSEIHQVVDYSAEHKEMMLINWHKYNWTKSADFRKALIKEIGNVKTHVFKEYLTNLYDGVDTVLRPSIDGHGTTVTVTVNSISNNTVNNIDSIIPNNNKSISNIYTNCFEDFWKAYPRKKEKSKAYKCYQARLKDGFSEDELLNAAKNYAEECEREHREERYIKLGATFLSSNTPFVDYLKGGTSDGKQSDPDAEHARWVEEHKEQLEAVRRDMFGV